MEIFIISLSIAYLLLVFYKSNVIAEYSRLLRIKWFKLGEYYKWVKNCEENTTLNEYMTYLEFLNQHWKKNFIVKLISCALCLCGWLSLVASVFIGFQYFLAIAALSLLFYFILVILFEKSEH